MAKPQTTSENRKRKRPFFLRASFWSWLFVMTLVLAALGALIGTLGYRFAEDYSKPYRERAEQYDLERINDIEQPSLIVDRNGREIGRFFVQNRSVIPVEDLKTKISPTFLNALIAGEDQRFMIHKGVDYIGVGRAIYLNLKALETTQGASTITQQLARNAYDLEGERRRRKESGIQRKIVEAFLAMRIEQRYSKDEIMAFYLNRIYFGSGYYGIRSASLGYFGKEPADLDALESAAIVGCIKNPSNNSPLNNLKANLKARNMVLDRMANLGMLGEREAHELRQTPLKLNPQPLRRGTTHLYERIAEAVGRVMGDDGLAAGGYTIRTTILAEAQQAAQQQLEETLKRAEARPGYRHPKHADYRKGGGTEPQYLQGACLMIEQETGEVLVHVGGRDYAQAPYDFIESGKRPLGTAFFPFVCAAALDAGLPPTTMVEDEPMDNRSVMVSGREGILGEWGMEVARPVYAGQITMRRALEQSKVAATVRLVERMGLQVLIKKAVDFQLLSPDIEPLRRIAVGFEPVSMKQALRAISVFSQGGQLLPEGLVYLDRIEDSGGRVVYQREVRAREKRRVIDEVTAWQVHDMLAGGCRSGSAKGFYDGMKDKPFHGVGKGGSTHDFGDCWFLGYNRKVSCGVWTGFLNANGQPIYPGAFSRDLAMPVWQAAMNEANRYFEGGPQPMPEGVIQAEVCRASGQRTSQFCQEYVEDPQTKVVSSSSTGVTEYFRAGNEQSAFCQIHAGIHPDVAPANFNDLGKSVADAVPVRPKTPVLLGVDPFHSEAPMMASSGGAGVVGARRASVLDSFDLSEREDRVSLPRPKRLEILGP